MNSINKVDFFPQFWHYLKTMQKIEKWRIQELMLVLQQLILTLKRGNSPEWANVFAHYHSESQGIFMKGHFDLHEIKKLVRNIYNCFMEGKSFTNLAFQLENQEEAYTLNNELYEYRVRLYRILNEMEERLTEYIH